jgi:HAD superfamily hydrolase (TIGR01490 family)
LSATAAFFDIDGTLVKLNIIDYYLYLATREVSIWQKWSITLKLICQAPYYLVLDRLSRKHFNQFFYRNYKKISVAHCQKWSEKQFQEIIQPKLFPAALDCINYHKQQGRKIILVTGSLDFVVAPLAEFLGAKALTASLKTENEHFTGQLLGYPMAGKEKARRVRLFALEQGIDLKQSYAYGDSADDIPMLRTVGKAIAVNPDTTLHQEAVKKGWHITNFDLSRPD